MKKIGNLLGFTIFLLVLLILSPWIYAQNVKRSWRLKKMLKNDLKEHNGKIVFLYGEYHTFNFVSYFQKQHPEIHCIEVPNHNTIDPFITYLNVDNPPKSLPQLVKIIDGHTFKKKHYSSFKHYVLRKKDVESFYKLIESSIKNLEEII